MPQRGGRRRGLDEAEEQELLGEDFRLHIRGKERLAECRICFTLESRPMKMAKVQQHRATVGHKKALAEVPADPQLAACAQLPPEANRDQDQAVRDGTASPPPNHGVPLLERGPDDDGMYEEPQPAALIAITASPSPEQRRDLDFVAGLQGRLEAMRFWTEEDVSDQDPQGSENEENEEEIIQQLAGQFELEDIMAHAHEDWYPFLNKAEMYALLICQNPRHLLSVKAQQLLLSYARFTGGRDVPSQKGLTVCRQRLHKTLSAPPMKQVRGNGHIFFASSLAAGLAREFASPSARQAMKLVPRQGPEISELQDGQLFHDLDADLVCPCVVTPGGTSLFINEAVKLKNGDSVMAERWIERDDGQIWGSGQRLDQAGKKQGRCRFRVQDVQDRAGSATPLFSVPILLQCDDLSGARSKRWNLHYQLCWQNGALSHSELAREKNIHLFAVTTTAQPLELVAELVHQLKSTFERPIKVWDASLRREVLVRPFLYLVLADNVMASALCTHVGTGNNTFPCRICLYGGTKKDRRTAAGLQKLLKAGEARSSEKTIGALKALRDLAIDGKTAQYFHKQRESGVKDQIVEDITDILFELRAILSGRVPAHPGTPARKMKKLAIDKRIQDEAEVLCSGDWYNALLSLQDVYDFDVHQQSPVEVLHSLWLGPAKYLTAATVQLVDADVLRTHLESLNTDGLDCG